MNSISQVDKKIKIYDSLLPLSWLYEIGVSFRNQLFDWGILSSEEFPIPVISIGNLSVGGTGKTPHTEYIVNLLINRYKVAVLSRGYKRKTKGFLIANELSTAKTIGDESFQIHKKFPSIIVAVDSNRRRGIKKLLELPETEKPEVIILDDAFQHRYVKPSLSILLTDFNRPFYEDKLLPSGLLREPRYGSSRADIVICTKCPNSLKPIDYRLVSNNMGLYPYQDLFFSSFKYRSLHPVFEQNTNIKKECLEYLAKNDFSFLVVTGIAKPEILMEHLEQYSKDTKLLDYPDHHQFSNKDIKHIIKTFEDITNDKKIIVTTEKDAARLINDARIPNELKQYFFYLPIEVIFLLEQEDLFKQKIESHVKNFARNRIMA
ncbi:tetraacyldisaccharide 4'-kinase [Dysgonomonadaceae bacterium PH5-43]|nr:tetraacyldisaccharide 4'-kinase [Dysgonomonadaceae bacterium PH5-43]